MVAMFVEGEAFTALADALLSWVGAHVHAVTSVPVTPCMERMEHMTIVHTLDY